MTLNLTADVYEAYEFSREFVSLHKEEFKDYFVFPYIILSVVVYVTFGRITSFNYRRITPAIHKKILFITAHPDDECMFFSPIVSSLVKEGHLVKLLCLTTGNYYGDGTCRQKELLKSCKILGIPEEHVAIDDRSELPDDPSVNWDVDTVKDRLTTVIYSLQPNSVITFDSYGVSGHKNHRIIYKAVKSLCEEGKLPENTKVFVVDSVNLLRKYVSILDVPLTYLFSRNIYMSGPLDVLRSWRAMCAHWSQFVWFRMLYIVFSRYMLINSMKEICHNGDC